MAESAKHGVAASSPATSDEPYIVPERAAIDRRRARINKLPMPPSVDDTAAKTARKDRTNSDLTGLALSGGGIRSASFGLGVLQGLHVGVDAVGIDGIDYLSTVSGGGYIGSALTCCMQHTNGEFPFTDRKNRADTDAVRHIRDFSNYLIPRGGTDIVTALGIAARGIVANAMIVLPVIFILVWITLFSHPTPDTLNQPKILAWRFADALAALGLPASNPVWGLNGFWFTIIILVIDILFLICWVLWKSVVASQALETADKSAELQGGFASVSKFLFFLTILTAWIEFQPFFLYLRIVDQKSCVSSPSSCFASSIEQIHELMALAAAFVPLGIVTPFLEKYLNDVVLTARHSTSWTAWFKKLGAKAALWAAGLVVPLLLWLLYLRLTTIGFIAEPSLVASGFWRGLSDVVAPWGGESAAARLCLEMAAILFLLGVWINPNVTSLYRLYRDRLSKAFLFNPKPAKRDPNGDLPAVDQKLNRIKTDLCPYPIINAALNIEGSQFVNRRGRNADFFMFSPLYTGSDATTYIKTELIEREEATLDLGTAMAISAAAFSPNMGSATIKPLTLTLALLNIRLGYWLRNPHWIVGKRRSLLSRLSDFRSLLLFKEMFGLITERSKTVYLTDGGNIENLGVYSLLKRRCPVIIAVDAEADPTMSFPSFLTLERYARIDLGVTIDLPWQAIRDRTLAVDKAFNQSDGKDGNDDNNAMPQAPGPHCAAGEIDYGPDHDKKGILFYIKSSLTGDESDYVLDYKKRNPDFPHETTGDQFFGEEQLEAYRALGFHIVSTVLQEQTTFAVKPGDGETEDQARARILAAVRTAIIGT
jgi:hypothetical protein